MSKYIIRKDISKVINYYNNETILYRIQAIRNIKNGEFLIKKKDLGGWIESEQNLSQKGNCWIFPNCIAYQRAHRSGSSLGMGNSTQYGNSRQYGHSVQSGRSQQYGDSQQSGYSQQNDYSKQLGTSQQKDKSTQKGTSVQCGTSIQKGNSLQSGDFKHVTGTHKSESYEGVLTSAGELVEFQVGNKMYNIDKTTGLVHNIPCPKNTEDYELYHEVRNIILKNNLDIDSKLLALGLNLKDRLLEWFYDSGVTCQFMIDIFKIKL